MNIQNVISIQDADKVLSGIAIPPRPSVLNDINAESQRNRPDLRKIAQLIALDIGLSASMLKLVNSPYFGLSRKIEDPSQAVNMLGLTNVLSVVTGLSLKGSLGGGLNLERFWDTSDSVSNISARIATKLPGIPKETAFTFGLFRDCGIPILMQKFSDYKETLQLANADTSRIFTDVEDERHSTNHSVIGFILAKNWGLSEEIYKAILHHHNLDAITGESELTGLSRSLIAVSYLAEYIFDSMRLRQDPIWMSVEGHVTAHLGLSKEEIDDIKEDVIHHVA